MSGLPRQPFEIPFDSGLLTRGDKRAKPEPSVENLLNMEFDDIGGLRVRFPFGVTTSAITGGGTLTNVRRFAKRNGELLAFTVTGFYTWVPATNSWTYRGDHLAVMTDEQTVFSETDDQICCDRAELNGQIVYVWKDSAAGTVRIAVTDKTSGAVIQPPTTVGVLAAWPRLIALSNCVILLAVQIGPTANLLAYKITLSPYAITGPTIMGIVVSSLYDACKIPGRDQIYAAFDLGDTGPRHYKIASIDSSLTTSSVTAVNPYDPSLAAPQTISIAISPDALKCAVTIAQGYGIISSGVTNPQQDASTDIWTVPGAGVPAVKTSTTVIINFHPGGAGAFITLNNVNVTSAFRLVTDGGRYRCYVYWTQNETPTTIVGSRWNWIDTTGAIGFAAAAAPSFVPGMGLGARAFARDTHVYLIGTFGGLSFAGSDPTGVHSQLQNTYYLYRDDAFLIGKAVWGEGAGFHPSGWLPNVNLDAANATKYVVMEGIRRIVDVGSNSVLPNGQPQIYAERAPREVAFVFDDNRARRSLQIGETLYVTGSIVLQYDGNALTEVGFATYPWALTAVATATAGLPAAGGYSYKATDRWNNAAGEIDRSTTATVANLTSAGALKIAVSPVYLYITRKTGAAVEIWRTEVNPPPGAPFFLVTSQDPSTAGADNGYLPNKPTIIVPAAWLDNEIDATIAIAQANPQNDSTLDSLEPPGASIIMTDARRIYLAGVPGAPNTVYYSKFHQPGFVVGFNDFLSFDVPADGGAIVALGYLDGGLIVWTDTATYQYSGPGYSDTGTGGNFQLARVVSPELGAVSQDALNFSSEGWYVKTQRGWYLLDKGMNYHYVGAPVYRYDDEPVLAAVTIPQRHQMRVVTASRWLVLDTLVNQWAEWTIADGLDMLIDANGACQYLTSSGPRQEMTTWDGYAGIDTSLLFFEVETQWIKPDGRQQGRYVVDYVQLLGEYRSPCQFQVQIAKDYEYTAPTVPNWHTAKIWTPTPAIDGNALEVRTSPVKKRCSAIKVRINIGSGLGGPLLGPCARLTSLTGQFAVEPGIYAAIGAGQKQ